MIDDPLLASLADDLSITINTEAATAENAAPQITAAPAEEKPAEKKADPEPAKEAAPAPKVRVVKKPDITSAVEEGVRRGMAASQPVAPKLPDPKPEEIDTTGLLPEQVEEIKDAQFAETVDPSRKGYAKEVAAYYKGVDAWVEAKKKENPDRVFDRSDREFMEFIEKSRPKVSDSDRQKFKRDRVTAEVTAKVKADLAGDLEATRRTADEARVAPVIERAVSSFQESFQKATETTDPLAAGIYETAAASAARYAEDLLRVVNGVDVIGHKSNTADLSERHRNLLGFIGDRAEHFKKHGGDERIRDGREFVTLTEFHNAKVAGKDTSKIWTYGTNDLLNLIKTGFVDSANSQIKAEEERVAKLGFVRQPKAEERKKAEDPKPSSGIRVNPTPAPGAANTNAPAEIEHIGNELIQVLGLKS